MNYETYSSFKVYFERLTACIACLLLFLYPLYGQAPQNIPQGSTPTDWSDWSTWLIYVGLPIIIIVVLRYNRWKFSGRKDNS